MEFLAPWLLWGTLLGAVPILVHWLLRRRFERVEWGAMLFLREALEQQRRWLHLDEWLLLLVRICIPVVLAIALAGPIGSARPTIVRSQQVHRIVVLDASASMQTRQSGTSYWDLAQRQIQQLVDQSQVGDTWQLIYVKTVPPLRAITEPTANPRAIIDELQQYRPTDEIAHVTAAAELVLAALAEVSPGTPCEVHWFTDAQRANWWPDDTASRTALRTVWEKIASQAVCVWHEIGSNSVTNAAILSCELPEQVIFRGETIPLTVVVKQYLGNMPERRLTWLANDRVIASRTLTLSPGEEIRETIPWQPVQAGEYRLEFRLSPEDNLTVDDHRYAVIVVRDLLRILLVDGRPGPPFENATDLLKLALQPEGKDAPGNKYHVDVIPDGDLLKAPLPSYDIVFLCDIPRWSSAETALLEEYVQQGGRLVISVGPQLQLEAYNYHRLFPARCVRLKGDPQQREQAFGFLAENEDHPLLDPFRGNPRTGFDLVQTFRYVQTEPSPTGRVILRYDSGDAAIVEGSLGRGRVVLITTSLDRSWSTWAVWGHAFVPMMQELARYLAPAETKDRNGLVGQPLDLPTTESFGAASVQAPAPWTDQHQRLRIAGGQAPIPLYSGFYEVEMRSQRINFARNLDGKESDLARVSIQELRNRENLPFQTMQTAEQPPLIAQVPSNKVSQDYSRALVGLVLLLLLLEPWLTWNRSTGIILTSGLLLLSSLGSWSPWILIVGIPIWITWRLWSRTQKVHLVSWR
ncbi:MAG: hypothetical protein KatS3mg113_0622 [Planctomycetaceae bacterium]|nr:MAG: hypothetical protein KatS3mg113_0622 [Planctomycetaceae bacterium]